MWLSCKFPSGGNFKYTIRRYEKKLELAFSNDSEELKVQVKVFTKWAKTAGKQTYGEMFNKLHALCLVCNTGKDLINLMIKDNGKR